MSKLFLRKRESIGKLKQKKVKVENVRGAALCQAHGFPIDPVFQDHVPTHWHLCTFSTGLSCSRYSNSFNLKAPELSCLSVSFPVGLVSPLVIIPDRLPLHSLMEAFSQPLTSYMLIMISCVEMYSKH